MTLAANMNSIEAMKMKSICCESLCKLSSPYSTSSRLTWYFRYSQPGFVITRSDNGLHASGIKT